MHPQSHAQPIPFLIQKAQKIPVTPMFCGTRTLTEQQLEHQDDDPDRNEDLQRTQPFGQGRFDADLHIWMLDGQPMLLGSHMRTKVQTELARETTQEDPDRRQ